jgi:prevent-host-death family protein
VQPPDAYQSTGHLFPGATIDLKTPPASDSGPNTLIAEKSDFALNGASEMQRDGAMKIMSAREAKNGVGLMIDTAHAEPVLIGNHGRGVVVVVLVEEYERPFVQSGRADKGRNGDQVASKCGL